MSDLLESIKMFGEGLVSLNKQSAIKDARAKLAEMNASVAKEDEKLAFANQIGQDLALRLTGAGAAPAEIQAVTEGLVPSASGQAANASSQKMQEASHRNAEKLKQIDVESDAAAAKNKLEGEHKNAVRLKQMEIDAAKDLQTMKNEALVGKQKAKQGAFLTGYQNKYNKETEKLNQGIQVMDTADQVLRMGNPIGDASVGVMFARASGDVGAVSDYAEQKFKGSKGLLERIAQAKSEWSSGTMSEDNRKFMLELSQKYREAKKKQIKEVAHRYSRQAHQAASRTGFDTTPEEMYEGITGSPPEPEAPAAKVLAKKLYSAKMNKTKLIYTDGSEEIVDGSR